LPTYAYRCHDCGYAFDVVQSFTDDSLTVCPECSGVLRKQFGHIAVTFKGSGFYRTDSRSAGAGSLGPGSGSAKSGSDGGSGGAKSVASGTTKPKSSSSKAASKAA
jgi:putative FmdB family regulatory protein